MGEKAGRGRRLVLLLAVGAAYACNPTGNGCDPAPSSELRFFKNGVLRNTRSTLGADTFAPVELAPVPGDSLPINVDIYATGVSLAPVDNQGILLGRQMEAHLFTEDLPGTMTYLRSLKADDSSGPGVWDLRTLAPFAGQDVILTYPPSPMWDLSQRYAVSALGSPSFWPNVAPQAPGSDPTGQGSVKSARLYQPGMCSLEYAFQTDVGDGLFNQIGDQLWDNFKDKPPCGGVERTFSRVTTLLDEGLGSGGTPRGGFFVYFTFLGQGCVTPVAVSANAEYEMGLDDGRLAVTPKLNDVVTTGASSQDIVDALQTTLPVKLHELAIQKQVKAFLACDPQADLATSTKVSRDLLGNLASGGANKLGYNPSEQQRVKDAIEDTANWVCDAGTAKFMLRAKRANVYPDGVEMVWFDVANPDDPMFGLYAAAVETGGVGDLCARPRTFVGSPHPAVAARPITTVCAGNIGCAF